MAIENRLVEYDEYQDEYSELSKVPDDTSIDETPPGEYGTKIEDESINVNAYTFQIHNNQVYASGSPGNTASLGVSIYNLDGTLVTRNAIRFPGRAPNDGISRLQGTIVRSKQIHDIKIMNNQMFMLYSYTIGNAGTHAIAIIDLSPNPRPTRLISYRSLRNLFGSSIGTISRMAVTPERIILYTTGNRLRFIDHAFNNAYPDEDFVLPINIRGLDATSNFIYTIQHGRSSPAQDIEVRVFTYGGVEVPNRRFLAQKYRNSNSRVAGLQVIKNKLYTYLQDARSISVFSIIADLNFHSFIPYQFDTPDFLNIYVLATNTITGDVRFDTTFNRVRIYKYLRSTKKWTDILNPKKGQPQLGMPYDFQDENRILADNRKNFRVIRHNNKTLIFYRRVQAGSSGIAMYNESDDVIVDVHQENFTTDDQGLPYSMDFWVDERNDGIYVYSFVVRYVFSGGNFSSATLKVYRRRMQPTETQTEIFSETFTGTSGDDLYPVSVSDLILAPDRSGKWYFTLDYQSKPTTHPAKPNCANCQKTGGRGWSERPTPTRCSGPRSPARLGNRYFYLEGGWVRLPKSDDPSRRHPSRR